MDSSAAIRLLRHTYVTVLDLQTPGWKFLSIYFHIRGSSSSSEKFFRNDERIPMYIEW
jgi:hypothetical protein